MQVFVAGAAEPLQQEARSQEQEEVCVSAVSQYPGILMGSPDVEEVCVTAVSMQQYLAPALSTPARLSVSTTETDEDLMLSSPENEEDSKWFLHERDLLITEEEEVEEDGDETFNWEDFIHGQGKCDDSSSLAKTVTDEERSHFCHLASCQRKLKKVIYKSSFAIYDSWISCIYMYKSQKSVTSRVSWSVGKVRRWSH